MTGGYPLPDGLTMGWLSLSTDELQDVGCRYDPTHVMVERDRGFRGDLLFSGRSFDVYPVRVRMLLAPSTVEIHR